ncbi:MAG: sulfite exporter TauE/SafE family protein [Bacteroidia bacterium]
MNVALFLSALALGFLGSFHCAGMCGPIALMLPKSSGSQFQIITGRFIYNSGRVFTYITIGLLFGMLGLAVAMKGFQRELSVFTGVIIVATVLLTSGKKERVKIYSDSNLYTNTIRKSLKKLFSIKSYPSLFLIGVLNGLLPCGFVYLAIAGAASTGSVTGGIIYMSLFGLGTFPMMMMISLAANYLGLRFRKIFTKVSPLIAIALALFLIYRGTDMKTDSCIKEKANSSAPIYCRVPAH